MHLAPLASIVLDDHRRSPRTAFYDLPSLGSAFTPADVQRLDAAYRDLVDRGLLDQSSDHFISFAGHTKPTYRLRSAPSATNGHSRKGTGKGAKKS